jgi:hypothetical protein
MNFSTNSFFRVSICSSVNPSLTNAEQRQVAVVDEKLVNAVDRGNSKHDEEKFCVKFTVMETKNEVKIQF